MSMTSAPAQVRLRPMTDDDLNAAYALSQKLKWPHRLEDWQLMHRVSRGFVAEDAQGVFATAFCCVQGAFSTIGLVIVSDERQGQGFGRKLMELALAASDCATATLAATVAGTPLYASQGFEAYEQLSQHQGTVLVAPEPVSQTTVSQTTTLRPVDSRDHAALLALASAGSGLERQTVLAEILAIGEAAYVIEREGALVGFAVLRPFGRGSSIGPVIAESAQQAQALISRLLAQSVGRFVRIDVTASSGLGPWLEQFGLADVGTVVQMSRGPAPQACGAVRQFAVITQALG